MGIIQEDPQPLLVPWPQQKGVSVSRRLAMAVDIENLELYCRNKSCGDAIHEPSGETHYTKRRMVFVGRKDGGLFGFTRMYAYMCPVCNGVRRFFNLDFPNRFCGW